MKLRDVISSLPFDLDAFLSKTHISQSTCTQPSFVYVLSCDRYFKVGIARNVASRMADLQTTCPLDIDYVTHREFDGLRYSLLCEKAAHQMLSEYHHRGEWFKAKKPVVLAAVDAANRATLILKRKHDAIRRKPVNDNVAAHVFRFSPMARA